MLGSAELGRATSEIPKDYYYYYYYYDYYYNYNYNYNNYYYYYYFYFSVAILAQSILMCALRAEF
eukprot:15621144-Heterocapsa_arctica.AAC.1